MEPLFGCAGGAENAAQGPNVEAKIATVAGGCWNRTGLATGLPLNHRAVCSSTCGHILKVVPSTIITFYCSSFSRSLSVRCTVTKGERHGMVLPRPYD